MFMSTRYKKKDPEWRQKWLFNVEDSLAKLLECLSIEYSVSKLISPKWKNFRSQKLKFESKTRINNAIWRCWHIQYKESKRPRFFKFDMPFSDQTVHSTPQAVILEGKTWKKRLDIVSREYKKWRKFYNVKILRGGGEDTDNLKQQLSNENSEDEFSSDDDDDNNGKKYRQSPTKNPDIKVPTPAQKLFQSSELMMDTYLADLPDTLFSSIRPAKSAAENALGLTYTDLSDMIQPTLDQLNPCFDELLQNFDFLTNDWGTLHSNTRSMEPSGHSVAPLHDMIDNGSLQPGLINTDSIYNEPLASASSYLYSSEVLYTPDPASSMDKSSTGIDTITPLLSKDPGDEGLQFTAPSSLRKRESGKRPLSDAKDVLDSPLPKKVIVKDVDRTSQFLNDVYLQKGEPNRQASIAPTEERGGHLNRSSSNFEALLSNAIDMSANQNAPTGQTKPTENMTRSDIPNRGLESKEMSIDTVEEIISVDSQFSQRKMFVNQIATTKVVEYSELPPQLQAPNLTAHLQAVMSTRNANPAIPRNKSDTQLSLMADKFASPQSLKVAKKEVSPLVKGKRQNNVLPRNMSDSNLVHMKKDTCRVYTRRRMASISVDTKPLILPRNFSDSNLCSLGRGLPRRPQPILPKSLIGIVPPSQSRVNNASTKAAISQVETTTRQLGASSASGTSGASGSVHYKFGVNKQPPTSTDPVQVTLYMPKSKKTAQVSAVPKENTAVSKHGNLPPQRVEVIQYKGPASSEQGSKIVGIVPAVPVTPTASSMALQPSPSLQRPIQSVPTHRDSAVTNQHSTCVIQHDTLVSSEDPFQFTPPVICQSQAPLATVASSIPASPISGLQHGNRRSDMSHTIQNPGNSIGNATIPGMPVQAPTPGPTQVTAPSVVKADSIGPTHELSEQKLILLAQVLQGSRSGDIGQETTIAFLEALQKEIETMLGQQQGKAKTQQNTLAGISADSLNSGKTTVANNQGMEHVVTLPYASLASATLPTTTLTSASLPHVPLPSVPLPTAPLPSVPLPSSGLPISAFSPISLAPASCNSGSSNLSQKLINARNVMGSSLSQENIGILPREKVQSEREVTIQQLQTLGARNLPQSIRSDLMPQAQTQLVEANTQRLNLSNKNIAPGQIYTAANKIPFIKVSDVGYFSEGQRCVPQQSVSYTEINPNMVSQNLTAANTPVSFVGIGSHLPQKTISSQQNTQQMSIQQPILLGVNSDGLASTVDASVITLSVIPPLSATQATGVISLGSTLSNQSSVVTVAGADPNEKPKTSGTSPRPTMVDLAIAASQRTYLTDSSSVSASQGSTTVPVDSSAPLTIISTGITSHISQSSPAALVATTSASPANSSEAGGAKRSRLRFQDREMYKEYRRKNHVTAEQKRRGLIKVAFDQMISLIPSLQEDRHGRTSKALVLQKAADYIEHLEREKELTKYKIEKMRREVNRLNEEIKVCQGKLPACGAISEQQNTRDAKTSYMEYIRQRVAKDTKYWLFCVMLRPLFESFNDSTSTRTLQEFIHSVLQWFEDNCSLTVLRPAVMSSLRQIGKETTILTNPSALPEQAQRAANCIDPTLLGQQPSFNISEAPSQLHLGTSTPAVVCAPSAMVVPSQAVRLAVQPQQFQQQEFTHSRQSYVTWSTQLPQFRNDLQ